MFINRRLFWCIDDTKCQQIEHIDISLGHLHNCLLFLAPINQPTEVRVKKIDDASVWVWWRGVSTDQTEEPLEGYMVRGKR